MVSADSSRVSRAPPYSGTGFESRSFSSTRLSRPMAPLSRGVRLTTGLVTLLLPALQPPSHPKVKRVWASSDFARHYFRNRGCFLFLQVLRWFTSLGLLTPAYVFSRVFLRFAQVGFPIRRSPDITPVCGSPELIAACHVLHRLFLPRHPPCALSSLTIELIPRRKRSCCLLLDIPCIFPPVRLTGYDPRLRTLSKDTQ